MLVRDKNVVVVGMARSGLSAAELLRRNGARVTVSDNRAPSQLQSEIEFLTERNIGFEAGGHSEKTFLESDLVVVSPGVPLALPLFQRLRNAGREIWSEIELASRFLKGQVIGITGSNGKTTTTSLVGDILKVAGFKVQVGGNIGTALSSLVETSDDEMLNVVELSSFQLEAIPTFRPHVAVILNITPDHMDRYDSFAAYVEAKWNLFKNQSEEDFAVVNLDDLNLRQAPERLRCNVFGFSLREPVRQGTCLERDSLVFRIGDECDIVIDRRDIQLKGAHNLENVAAAITATRLVGAAVDRIAAAVMQFRGVEHRLEWVRELDGVQFFNDSKATNTDSTLKALEAFEGGVILILGGRDKGGDFSLLLPAIEKTVKSVVLLGESSAKIRAQLSGAIPLHQAQDMEHAVRLAVEQATAGDIVLLAPACASFDMFQNYEHRGRVFKEAVLKLNSNPASRTALGLKRLLP